MQHLKTFVSGAAAASALLATAGTAQAAEAAVLRSGAYEVEAVMEMSFPEDKPEKYRVCLSQKRTKPARGLFIVTPDTPISACPVSNVRETAGTISFDIICAGTNAGNASAVFEVTPDSYKGRIAILMGGKNMRMTEVQVGRRVGDCGADEASQSR